MIKNYFNKKNTGDQPVFFITNFDFYFRSFLSAFTSSKFPTLFL
jgi:hypothetical protein